MLDVSTEGRPLEGVLHEDRCDFLAGKRVCPTTYTRCQCGRTGPLQDCHSLIKERDGNTVMAPPLTDQHQSVVWHNYSEDAYEEPHVSRINHERDN